MTEEKFVIEFHKKSALYLASSLGGVVLLYWGLNHLGFLGSSLSSLYSIVAPFLLGLAIAFVANVLLRALEKIWDKLFGRLNISLLNKIKRPCCITFCGLLLIGAVFALLFMIIPEFKSTIISFVNMMPQYMVELKGWWADLVEFAAKYNIVLPKLDLNNLNEAMNLLSETIKNVDGQFVGKTIEITMGIVAGIFNMVLGIVFAIYVLAQKEKLGANFKKAMYAFFPEKKVDSFLDFVQLTGRTFTNFVTGQLTEACIIGVLCFLGMCLFGMPYASVISVLVGVTALIPIFGAFIGTGIGALMILMVEPIRAVWFVVFIIVLQQLEGNLIYPRVVGKSVGLPGIWVLAAVTIGGNLWGIVGMLLSVPICAVLYCLLRREVVRRTKQKQEKSAINATASQIKQ